MAFNIKGCSKPLKITGEIVHSNEEGIGVKFTDLNKLEINKLENIVVQIQG